MRRERLRPAPSDEELLELYPRPHDARTWADHRVRVDVTIAIAQGFAAHQEIESVADLSAGNGEIARAVQAPVTILGDLAPGYPIAGPIEQTLELLPAVDLYVCSETLEHLDNPDLVLARIRERTTFAVISTPIEAWNDHGNREHLWAWDREAVEQMISSAGFLPAVYNELDMRRAWSPYCFGVWGLA